MGYSGDQPYASTSQQSMPQPTVIASTSGYKHVNMPNYDVYLSPHQASQQAVCAFSQEGLF